MNNLRLVFPSEDKEINALEFKREFLDNGEKTINGSYKLDMDRYTYSEWLQIVRDNMDKDKMNPKFGFSHTLFAMNEDNKIIGIVNFRHVLTEFYKDSGHIGYSVRPLERKKGYATEILRLTLDFAKKQGLSEVFLVCKRENVASIKTIMNNEGLLIRTFMNSEVEYQEYRIEIR